MATLPKELPQTMAHDFFRERRWLTVLSGFSASSSVAYSVYRYAFIFTIFYMSTMAACACVFVRDKQLIINATHFLSISAYNAFWSFTFRHVHYRALEKTRSLLISGVYCYKDEDQDEEITKMRESMPREIRRKSFPFYAMYLLLNIFTTTVFPLSQLVFLDDNGDQGVINPYFPHLFYQPFNTRGVKGTAIAWVMGTTVIVLFYSINCTVSWYYISGVVQLNVHFRILNHSIRNIPRRALSLYSKMANLPAKLTSDHLLQCEHYQHCLFLSFRSNIQHHQALLRLRKDFEPFSGSFALCVFLVSPIVYGCSLYIIMQAEGNPINVTFNMFLTFTTEQFTIIFICFLGEEVILESEELFNRLYSTDWLNYDQRFKQILHIMMSNTIKPVGVKALLLNVPASFKTYSDVMTAMYKLTSIVRQSDLV